MRILLTGSSGFVGRHLVPLLERCGHDLIHLVRAPRGFGREVQWSFGDTLPDLPPCEAVVHLAAHVDFNAVLGVEQFRVNTVSTMRLATFARKARARFVLASMAGVHGAVPHIDATSPIVPSSGYAMSKYLAEEAVRTSVDRYSILRIGGIYGCDGPAHLGLNVAISRAYHFGEPPVLRGSGAARRNYICVEDVARWVQAVLEGKMEHGADGEVLYMAGQEVLTIANYLETIAKLLLANVPVHHADGLEAADSVIVPSTPPFRLTSFPAYLTALALRRRPPLVSGSSPR